eukprot:RCo021842
MCNADKGTKQEPRFGRAGGHFEREQIEYKDSSKYDEYNLRRKGKKIVPKSLEQLQQEKEEEEEKRRQQQQEGDPDTSTATNAATEGPVQGDHVGNSSSSSSSSREPASESRTGGHSGGQRT